MLLNQPIPKQLQRRYAEGSSLRSSRDKDTTSQQWKGVNGVTKQSGSDGDVLTAIQKQLRKLGRRQTGYQAASTFIQPFQIYNCPSNTPATSSNFTFQIRGGLIGYRSQYFLGTSLYGKVDFEEGMIVNGTDGINGVDVESDSDAVNPIPTLPEVAQVTLANATDTLIWDDAGTFNAVQVVLDSTLDSLNTIQAAFWVKIIDDPSVGLYTQLWGRMWTNDPIDPTGRPTTPYPNTGTVQQDIIRLGTVYSDLAFEAGVQGWEVLQEQSGNLMNRYAALAPLSAPYATPNDLRGWWTADTLSGEVFYGGDLVMDDTTPYVTVAGTNFYAGYVYQGGINIETDAPHLGIGSKWKQQYLIVF